MTFWCILQSNWALHGHSSKTQPQMSILVSSHDELYFSPLVDFVLSTTNLQFLRFHEPLSFSTIRAKIICITLCLQATTLYLCHNPAWTDGVPMLIKNMKKKTISPHKLFQQLIRKSLKLIIFTLSFHTTKV